MKYASLRQGLVGAYCPSLGATGQLLVDRSDRKNHLALTGMSPSNWVADVNGVAITTGTGQFATGSRNSIGNFSGEFTALAWIKPTGTQAVDYSPLAKFENVASGNWMIWIDGARVKAYWSGTRATGASTVLTSGVWQLVAISYRNGSATCWYNGLLDASASSVAPITTGTGQIQVGTYSSGLDRALRGSVGPCLLYERAITDAEHFQFYCGGIQFATQVLQPTPQANVFFGAQLFNAAWARNSNVIISPVGAA